MAMAMKLAAPSSTAPCADCYARSTATAWQQGSWQGPASTSFPSCQLFATRSQQRRKTRRGLRVRASAAGSGSSAIVPVKLESPVGQFLISLLESHPHLFNAAAEQQIQLLVAEKEAGAEETKPSGSDLVLYKRIAEVKERERHKAIVELIYALVVEKFLGVGAGLVPKLDSSPDTRVDYNWPLYEKELESIHSPEVLEVVREHLGMILGSPAANMLEQHTLVKASKMRLGHMYAATVVFGYFLKRLDQRYQLEMGMQAMLTSGETQAQGEVAGVSKEMDFVPDAEGQELAAELNRVAAQHAAAAAAAASEKPSSTLGIFPHWRSNSKLKSYVMSLDQESLQRFASLRSKESLEVVERQTQALFGKPEAQIAPDGSLMLLTPKDDSFMVSLSGLRRMVLEAVAFGTFLWEAESHVDRNYTLS